MLAQAAALAGKTIFRLRREVLTRWLLALAAVAAVAVQATQRPRILLIQPPFAAAPVGVAATPAGRIPEMGVAMAALAGHSKVLVVRADMLALAVLGALSGRMPVILRPPPAAAEAAEVAS